MESENMISVNCVTKTYKLYKTPTDRFYEAFNPVRKKYHTAFFALNNISFDVRKGETLGIIGRNGSGKSTLLKIITGVLTPSSGNVSVGGRISALLELGAGFNMEMTGLENIYFNGTILGYSREEMDIRIKEIIAFADIGDFINQPVKTYSSGMFVRLAFAFSINVDPEILIIDEALSVGDMFFQHRCFNKFNEFKKSGKTIILVSHDLSSILQYCDRVVVMDKGTLVEQGCAKDMIDLYKKILVSTESAKEDTDDKSVIYADNKVWKDRMTLNKDTLTYGDGSAEIIDYGLFGNDNTLTQIVETGDRCMFKMRVMAKKEISNPIYAITIKDIKGTEICGTNSLYENIDVPPLQSGQVVTVSFSQEIHLKKGAYFVSFGCTTYEGDELKVYHRCYDAFSFDVVTDKSVVGFFDMCSKMTVN